MTDHLGHTDRSTLEALVRPGDQLQSAASRMAEYLLNLDTKIPYEVLMAAHEANSAVDEWTKVRRQFR